MVAPVGASAESLSRYYQNISLFCSGTGLTTYPRANMNKEALAKALKLASPQTPMLCHPVGYKK